MRIAISGSAGTGKSSLAKAIADRFECALVPECYDDFFTQNAEFIKPASQLKQLISNALERKNALESEHLKFVADRCPVDLFNLWLSRGFATNRNNTAELYQRCRSYMAKYDFIVVLPWSALPLQQLSGHATNRRRVMNLWTQLHNHSTIIGLLQQWVPQERLLPIPYPMIDINARAAAVSAAVVASGPAISQRHQVQTR
jgi:hypothetical protein